jgi:acetyl esterase/lipase
MATNMALSVKEKASDDQSHPPVPKLKYPLIDRLSWCATLYFYKIAASIIFFFRRGLHRASHNPRPRLVIEYPCRPGLKNRVFFPPHYDAGDTLPLYLSIHGGGFSFGEPEQDDGFCESWAKRTGMLVVSVDYRKAPMHPFPTASYDVAAIANSILCDERLPIDTSRVAMGGFSAGGNLALSASHLPGLKGTVKAIVAYYPVIDFSISPSIKLAFGPYKGGPKDRFGDASWWLDWGYIRVGENRRHALLSPCYAKKSDLPPWIYIVGAQWGMFRLEAQSMIHGVAGLEDREDQEEPFEKDTYKWTMAKGCSHGFTHSRTKDPVRRSKNQQTCEQIYQEAHKWLKKSVLES